MLQAINFYSWLKHDYEFMKNISYHSIQTRKEFMTFLKKENLMLVEYKIANLCRPQNFSFIE